VQGVVKSLPGRFNLVKRDETTYLLANDAAEDNKMPLKDHVELAIALMKAVSDTKNIVGFSAFSIGISNCHDASWCTDPLTGLRDVWGAGISSASRVLAEAKARDGSRILILCEESEAPDEWAPDPSLTSLKGFPGKLRLFRVLYHDEPPRTNEV
jgi:hypothetical protein